MYEDADKVSGRTVCESVLGLLTCYISRYIFPKFSSSGVFRICITPLGYQKMDKIDDFICEKNEKVMVPKGLYVMNPIEKGFRAVSFLLR